MHEASRVWKPILSALAFPGKESLSHNEKPSLVDSGRLAGWKETSLAQSTTQALHRLSQAYKAILWNSELSGICEWLTDCDYILSKKGLSWIVAVTVARQVHGLSCAKFFCNPVCCSFFNCSVSSNFKFLLTHTTTHSSKWMVVYANKIDIGVVWHGIMQLNVRVERIKNM